MVLRRAFKSAVGSAFLIAAALVVEVPATEAQEVDTTLWCFSPGDRVLAIARMNHTLYLGGNFLYVGPSTGAGVPFDVETSKPARRYARVVGVVETSLADGAGGWYIGGLFTSVGGIPRRNLAHIAADGTVFAWDPRPNNRVLALALAGSTLYVGGAFDSVGTQPRLRVVALSTASESPLPFRCDADEPVTALVATDSSVFIGGWFSTLNGFARTFVGAVDPSTGGLRPWQVTLDERVSSLALRDSTLYIGGYFFAANGETHRCLVAVGAGTGAVHAWNPGLDRQPPSSLDSGPHVRAILCTGDSLFIAGSFTHVGGEPRQSIAQVDAHTAQPTGWNAHASRNSILGPEFFSMALLGDTLFVAGACDSIGGDSTGQVSSVSVRTAVRFPWDAKTNDFVFSISLQGRFIFLGGWFTSFGEWALRPGLAAIDESTGQVTDWDPHPNDMVKCLLAYGGRIYVGGNFSTVGGQPRQGIASLDPVTGRASAWDPGSNDAVWTLTPNGTSIIAGGPFVSFIGGQPRAAVAAIDTATGLATAWDARAQGAEVAVAVATDSVVYVGGLFSSIGGQPRESLAALDPVTGDATPWNPGADDLVLAITTLDSMIYVGGVFTHVSGQPRGRLAAIDRFGVLSPWAPDADFPVEALASGDSTIYAGGFFSTLFGESHEWFAALDPRRPAVRKEFPHPDGPVWALKADEGNIYVGGAFGKMGTWPQVCLAAIRPPGGAPQPIPVRLELAQSAPNPAHGSAVVRYALPTDLPVSLDLYDLQGRRVARVVSEPFQRAGRHEVVIPTHNLPAGCYLYRLQAGGLSAARKMVVIQ